MVEIRVNYYETDAMGIVHHSNYLRYFETARINYLRDRGVDYREWNGRGLNMPLVESVCHYKKPARFDDILSVKVIIAIDGVRINFNYELINKKSGELLCTGSTQHVCVDEKMKVIKPPEDFKRAVDLSQET